VIVRSDLSIPYRMIQGAHSAIDFQHQHPELAKQWNSVSNYLVFLSVETEQDLWKYLEKFEKKGLKVTPFFEPDIGNELTAIAVEPTEKARKMCSNLPLALKEYQKDFLLCD
jgi:hypothetical protein